MVTGEAGRQGTAEGHGPRGFSGFPHQPGASSLSLLHLHKHGLQKGRLSQTPQGGVWQFLLLAIYKLVFQSLHWSPSIREPMERRWSILSSERWWQLLGWRPLWRCLSFCTDTGGVQMTSVCLGYTWARDMGVLPWARGQLHCYLQAPPQQSTGIMVHFGQIPDSAS